MGTLKMIQEQALGIHLSQLLVMAAGSVSLHDVRFSNIIYLIIIPIKLDKLTMMNWKKKNKNARQHHNGKETA